MEYRTKLTGSAMYCKMGFHMSIGYFSQGPTRVVQISRLLAANYL